MQVYLFGEISINKFPIKTPPRHFAYVNFKAVAADNVKLIKCVYQDDSLPFSNDIPC